MARKTYDAAAVSIHRYLSFDPKVVQIAANDLGVDNAIQMMRGAETSASRVWCFAA